MFFRKLPPNYTYTSTDKLHKIWEAKLFEWVINKDYPSNSISNPVTISGALCLPQKSHLRTRSGRQSAVDERAPIPQQKCNEITEDPPMEIRWYCIVILTFILDCSPEDRKDMIEKCLPFVQEPDLDLWRSKRIPGTHNFVSLVSGMWALHIPHAGCQGHIIKCYPHLVSPKDLECCSHIYELIKAGMQADPICLPSTCGINWKLRNSTRLI